MLSEITGNQTQSAITSVQKAKLYTEIYDFAKEDFFSIADMNKFYLELLRYFSKLESQLNRLFSQLASHTHPSTNGVTGPPSGTSTWTPVSTTGEKLFPALIHTMSDMPNTKTGRSRVILTGTILTFSVPRSLDVIKGTPIIPPIMGASL